MEDSKEYQDFLDGIKVFAEQIKGVCEQAYYVYKPQVDEICHRNASQNEVEGLLDWLLQYTGDDRMLGYAESLTVSSAINSVRSFGRT